MRKITPVMLVLLLVASLMANIDITQLEQTEVIEDTGGGGGGGMPGNAAKGMEGGV